MAARIIDRGRGPELEGTRITVYRIMDFLAYDDPPEVIARELGLTMEQVRVALNYIEAHRAEVEEVYRNILERVNRPNPPWVVAMLAKSPEELKRRILRRRRGGVEVSPGGEAMSSHEVRHASRVQQTPGVCGGEACIRETRHTVSGLVQWRRLGLSDEQILGRHPELSRADLEAAWSHYARHCEEIDRVIRDDEDDRR